MLVTGGLTSRRGLGWKTISTLQGPPARRQTGKDSPAALIPGQRRRRHQWRHSETCWRRLLSSERGRISWRGAGSTQLGRIQHIEAPRAVAAATAGGVPYHSCFCPHGRVCPQCVDLHSLLHYTGGHDRAIICMQYRSRPWPVIHPSMHLA